MNKYLQSNTVRLGAVCILGALTAYLSGQMDATGAVVLALTGVLQIIQRSLKLSKDGTSATPGEFPGVDAGPPGTGQ